MLAISSLLRLFLFVVLVRVPLNVTFLLQATGLVLSAVVVIVRFLGITVIGALGTLRYCETAR
jgi:hypothetical protein